MAEMIQNESAVPQGGKQRAKKLPAHIDMTPMVDLACLLLTFFMLTTAFVKPKVLEIVMPNDRTTPIPEKRVLNVIIAENNQVFLYNGQADATTGALPVMIKSDLTAKGLRKVLLERNKRLFEQVYYFNDSITKGSKEISKDESDKYLRKMKSADKEGPIVLIKAAEGVKYGTMVDVMDEMAITSVARYAVVDINTYEKKMLKDALAGKNVEPQY